MNLIRKSRIYNPNPGANRGYLALEKAAVGEGPNRYLVYELYRVLTSKGCTYIFNFRVEQGTELNRYILAGGR